MQSSYGRSAYLAPDLCVSGYVRMHTHYASMHALVCSRFVLSVRSRFVLVHGLFVHVLSHPYPCTYVFLHGWYASTGGTPLCHWPEIIVCPPIFAGYFYVHPHWVPSVEIFGYLNHTP